MVVSNSTDRFNKAVFSLAVKAPCVTVSTANLNLSGEQTVNTVSVVADDRVLVAAQTDPIENGIYDASTSAWIRALDFDGNRDVTNGTLVIVIAPTPSFYLAIATNPVKVGTSSITFSAHTL